MIAPQPNFLLLKEIRATVLSLDTYIDKKSNLVAMSIIACAARTTIKAEA